MREEHGSVVGPLTINDDFVLHGMVTGDAIVERGGFLQLHGMVTGSLRVADGGSAVVRGIVSQNILNAGSLEVYGIVMGHLDSTPDATTLIVPGSQINGVTQ
jgi:hypothetical protein